MKGVLVALLVLVASPAVARNWQMAIDGPTCDVAGVMTVGAQIRYLGPKAPVESPVVRLAEAGGKPLLPRGLVWRSGSKALAALLAGGGVRGLEPGDAARIELRFDTGDAAGPALLEFGDLPAFALTRKGRACGNLLKAPAAPAPQAQRAASKEPANLRVYRNAYPCGRAPAALKTIEADHPPYLPKQLLVLGRGYLPNTRHIELPTSPATRRAAISPSTGASNAAPPATRSIRSASTSCAPVRARADPHGMSRPPLISMVCPVM